MTLLVFTIKNTISSMMSLKRKMSAGSMLLIILKMPLNSTISRFITKKKSELLREKFAAMRPLQDG